MAAWIQLTAEKAQSFYRVPMELAEADGHFFYGAAHHPRDGDGPWPLVAFLPERDQPGVITFQLYTIEAEELEVEAFNPLAQPCGYLSLDRQALAELAKLLSSCAAKLTPARSDVRQMFRQIDDLKLADFALHPEWFPDSKDRYYYQIYDPLEESGGKSTQTILIFSTGQTSQSSSRLYFKVAHFSLPSLQEPSFDVLDDSFPRINLDRGGMEELARLLEGQLQNLTR
jgi:hypothetical protein